MASKNNESKAASNPANVVKKHLRTISFLKWPEIWSLAKNTFSAWSNENVARLGASLSYYTALSLAPLVVVVLAVVGLAFGRQAAQGELISQIQDTVGYDGAKLIQGLIQTAYKPASGIIATVLSLLTLFFGATSVVMELTDALNTIWHVPKTTAGGLKSFLRQMRQRLVSFGMILGIGFLLLVSLIASASLAAMGHFFGEHLPVPEFVLHLINLVVSFLVITLLFAMIYKILPAVKLEWNDVSIGAAVTALLFTLGKLGLGLYLGKSSVGSAYGAAGSFIVVLVWVYYSSQIFFLGAEFTRIYATQFGSLREGRVVADAVPPKQEEVRIIDPSAAPKAPLIILPAAGSKPPAPG